MAIIENLFVVALVAFVLVMKNVISRRSKWAEIFATSREFHFVNPKEEARQ